MFDPRLTIWLSDRRCLTEMPTCCVRSCPDFPWMWPAIPQRYAGAHGRHTHCEVLTMWEVHRVWRWRPCRACVGYCDRPSLSCLPRPPEARPLCRLLYLWTISGVRLCRRCVACRSHVDTRAINLAACLLLLPTNFCVSTVALQGALVCIVCTLTLLLRNGLQGRSNYGL